MTSRSDDERSDPFGMLGLGSDAEPAAIREARRRLAKHAHPDRGGDARRMQELNRAADAALAAHAADAALATRRADAETRPASTDHTTSVAPEPQAADRADPLRRSVSRIVEDVPSFVVEALPAEAFEALLAAAGELGQVIDADPPYLLDVVLRAPYRCWCRLELLPEAGASSVGLVLGGLDEELPPDVELVRDVWIETLNAGSPLPAGR